MSDDAALGADCPHTPKADICTACREEEDMAREVFRLRSVANAAKGWLANGGVYSARLAAAVLELDRISRPRRSCPDCGNGDPYCSCPDSPWKCRRCGSTPSECATFEDVGFGPQCCEGCSHAD